MSSFQIIVGSMLGGTEYVAEAVEEVLKQQNHQTKIHFKPNFSEINKENEIWLFCTSTHGAGDFPENIENFIHDLKQSDQEVDQLPFLVIAVGDSSYDTFCKAGKTLENIMLEKNANKLIDIFMIDMIKVDDPEESAQQWIQENSDQL